MEDNQVQESALSLLDIGVEFSTNYGQTISSLVFQKLSLIKQLEQLTRQVEDLTKEVATLKKQQAK